MQKTNKMILFGSICVILVIGTVIAFLNSKKNVPTDEDLLKAMSYADSKTDPTPSEIEAYMNVLSKLTDKEKVQLYSTLIPSKQVVN